MINKIIKAALLIFLSFTLFGCATEAKYVAQQKSWVNKSVVQYEKKFGYPNRVINVSPNPDIETYVYVMMAVDPTTPMYSNGNRGGFNPMETLEMAQGNPQFVQLGALKCTTWVSFNKKTKIISNITFRGNYCATDE